MNFFYIMLKNVIRLFKAFNKKKKETGWKNALKVSLQYTKNKRSLYDKNLNFSFTSNDLHLKPLVSILIVSYNSQNDLPALFDSINKQTYRNLEIIFIENGDINSENYLKNLNFPYKYISSSNIGFAAGNNLAFEHSKGDFFCLVNPDTVLDEKVIENLLSSLLSDSYVAVSVPKIVFYEKFIDFSIKSEDSFSLDLKILNESLNYKKYFVRRGIKNVNNNQIILSANNEIRISLPIDESQTILKFKKFSRDQSFYFELNDSMVNNNQCCKKINEEDYLKIIINACNKTIWWGKYLINNAGSDFKNDNPFDRGFAEYDLGGFDQPEYVNAFCGCVAMISSKVVVQRKIFIDEFFAYYEDSELSSWIKKNRLFIKYNPTTIVRHKHSASSEEGSNLWNTLVSRSKNMYDFISLNDNKKISRDIINQDYLDTNKSIRKILKSYDTNLLGKTSEELYKKSRPTAAIYNSYWNTMGGGEKHALSVAKMLSKTHEIYLLSEKDFDENKLKNYFSIDFKFRKFINLEINSSLTSIFDVFVNSTYNSSLVSYCSKSFYLVSFPHKVYNPRFIDSYFFLHNSTYTKNWAIKYWGDHRNEILYPIIEISSCESNIKKEKHLLENNKQNFISIGRFTKRGHAKRQDFILKAFNEAQNNSKSNFNLFLVGSLDSSSKEDLNYYKTLEKSISSNTYLFPNLEFSKLVELLSISKIYIQATGVEINAMKYPQNLEHFGISVIEALSYSNYPIVYNIGGPAETVRILKAGETFNSFDSLVKIFIRIMNDFSLKKYSIKKDFLDPLVEVNSKSLKLFNKELSS